MSDFNGLHYDRITRAWEIIIGKHFHYGYFARGTEDLESAAHAMILQMISRYNWNPEIRVLDVGCGVGHTACVLYEICSCDIHGITNSRTGVEQAKKYVRYYGYEDKITFLYTDATQSDLPDDHYDVIWILETSHLIDDKSALFAESYRLAKPGGKLLLCDIILKKPFSMIELVKYSKELSTVDDAFGKAKTESFDQYIENLGLAGFVNIETFDISENTIMTFSHWKKNAIEKKELVIEATDEDYFKTFVSACDQMIKFNELGFLGYGIVTAQKPGEKIIV